jgi:hypothetical protein
MMSPQIKTGPSPTDIPVDPLKPAQVDTGEADPTKADDGKETEEKTE